MHALCCADKTEKLAAVNSSDFTRRWRNISNVRQFCFCHFSETYVAFQYFQGNETLVEIQQ